MLRTKRLCLRNFCAEDAEIMFIYRNDERCNRYQRYDNTSLEYLKSFVKDYYCSSFLSFEEEQHYAIEYSENAEMIGDLSIFFNKSDNCFTLGITVAPKFQGKGFAYELLSDVVKEIKKRHPDVDIVALIEKGNERSISLFKKLSFALECYAESIESYVFVIYGKLKG